MAVQLGNGEYTFEVHENWAKVPEEITLGDCAAVGVDRQNRVYAFNRGEHPVAVFDAEGNLLRTWGEGVFHRPHGVHMGPDDTIYLTDDGDPTVRKCTLNGKVLMTLGVPREPKRYISGEPFHRCTHAALSPRGDLYVSDATAMRGSTNTRLVLARKTARADGAIPRRRARSDQQPGVAGRTRRGDEPSKVPGDPRSLQHRSRADAR